MTDSENVEKSKITKIHHLPDSTYVNMIKVNFIGNKSFSFGLRCLL